MAGMPVYGIVSVHFEGNRVSKMIIGPYSNGEMLARVERKRDWLMEKLRDTLLTVCTLRKNQNRWEIQDNVNVITVNGEKFLRIDQLQTAEDFFGAISQF